MAARSSLLRQNLAHQNRDILQPCILSVTETHHLDNSPKARGSATVCKVIRVAWVPPDRIKGHSAALKSSKSKHLEEIFPVLPKPGNLLPQEGDEANSQKQQMFISQSLILRSSQNPSDQVLLEPFIRQCSNLFAAQDLRK